MFLVSTRASSVTDKMAMFGTEKYNKDRRMPGAHHLVVRGAGGEEGMQLVPLEFYPHRKKMAAEFLRGSLQGEEGGLEERWWGGRKWLVNVQIWTDYVRPDLDHSVSTSIDRFLRIDKGENRRRRRKGRKEMPLGNTLFGVNRVGAALEVIAWDTSHWGDEVSRCLWQ